MKRILGIAAAVFWITAGVITALAQTKSIAAKAQTGPILTGTSNYIANEKKGAEDLFWNGTLEHSVYRVYRMGEEEREWEQVSNRDETTPDSFEQSFAKTGTSEYNVSVSGFYRVTTAGGVGGSIKTKTGGEGGLTEAVLYLKEGWRLCFEVGGGGKGSTNGSAGGNAVLTNLVMDDCKTTLMIAGGGGGATITTDGEAGCGSGALVEAGILSISSGGSGTAGGGGGYKGGTAGTLTAHKHKHATSGAAVGSKGWSVKGGCYTKTKTGTVQTKCGIYTFQDVQYYCNTCSDARNSSVNLGVGEDWRNGEHASHNVTRGGLGQVKCDICGASSGQAPCYEREANVGGVHYKTETSTYYELSCTKKYDKNTGAKGGTGYINSSVDSLAGETVLYRHDIKEGGNTGNPLVSVTPLAWGYLMDESMTGVPAPDLNPPEPIKREEITVTIPGGETENVLLEWPERRDIGSTYSFQVREYSVEDLINGFLTPYESNTIRDTLTVGTAGYQYVRNNEEETTVKAEMGGVIAKASLQINPSPDYGRYLHIAAFDKNGNYSETLHVDVTELSLLWNLHTSQMILTGEEGILIDENTIYLRADGMTGYEFGYEAYMDGEARADYQIDQAYFAEDEATVANILMLPSTSDGRSDADLTEGAVHNARSGDTALSQLAVSCAKRLRQSGRIQVAQRFVLPALADGTEFLLFPKVVAQELYSEDFLVQESEESEDRANGLHIIADGSAPEIAGLEPITEGDGTWDLDDGEMELVITASDDGSGVDYGSFHCEIENLDSGERRSFPSDNERIEIELASHEGDDFWLGELSISVYVADRVGNETIYTGETEYFGLRTNIRRLLEPVDGRKVFKRGESGCLDIESLGYVDWVEIVFPEELSMLDANLNRVYRYEGNRLPVQTQVHEFMVPLYAPHTESQWQYEIIIRAGRNHQIIQKSLRLNVLRVEGTVLDELITVLR